MHHDHMLFDAHFLVYTIVRCQIWNKLGVGKGQSVLGLDVQKRCCRPAVETGRDKLVWRTAYIHYLKAPSDNGW